ncbi:MAG: excinuclease ABC subunit UvrC [Salinivirgaceae bacterium]|nr:excinuclease ABC subunit UvrC [Salinivirgaceae bacterium]MDD4748137.1 excinuclease ABC subunit UvrC [Salinivirgaceae bacterium]
MSIPIREIASLLPENPGVYQFFDANDTIIYIGKAKNLRRRVLSYFTKTHDIARVRVMVKRIVRIEHIVVDTEIDALLLENNLIKKYQPRYNVLLKDDKTFPWICIKNEPFPRLFSTRNVVKDGSEYFGPFTSGWMVKTLIDFLRKTYYIRTCSLNLTPKNISEGKFRVCLEYQIGNCKGPCEALQSEDDYNNAIVQVRNVLKGNIKEAITHFRDQMNVCAKMYKFEEAEEAKQKMLLLENYQSKSTIVNASINNVDVFSLDLSENIVYVNYLKVIHGSIIQSYTLEIRKRLNESNVDILQMAIIEIRDRFQSTSNEAIVPFDPEVDIEGLKFIVPQKGDKKKLLELSLKNAKYYKLERLKQSEKANPALRTERLMSLMQRELNLSKPPLHIECFDNSNLQGTNAVAACVVFKNGKPSKKEYRKFHIKTVEGIDDFASMREIISRRYSRMLEENASLPDLIIVDGGKGQLSSAYETLLSLKIENRVSLISIAKRLEEIFIPNDPIPLYIDKNSQTLKVIQHLRNESHRFGITFHREVRSKEFVKSELDSIKGIGPKTIEKLLLEFKTIDNLKIQSLDTISAIVGADKAQTVIEHFKLKDTSF